MIYFVVLGTLLIGALIAVLMALFWRR